MPDSLQKFVIGVETVDQVTVDAGRRGGIAVKRKVNILAANKKQAKRRAIRLAETRQGVLGFAFGDKFTVNSVQLANERNRNFIKAYEVVITNQTWNELRRSGELEQLLKEQTS